jgi:NADPH2 dehydrogenase
MIFKNLLSPLIIGSLKLKNRIVMPPMVIWKSDESAEVKDAHLEHYRNHQGPGLIIVEATTVSPEGRLHENQLGVFSEKHIEGLKKIADIIHAGGAAAGIQLHHAGGKATPQTTYGLSPLVPSVDGVASDKICDELTVEDIQRIINDFSIGAERAVAAGFDLIELHGAHGYLGSQFLSPITNRRTDEYGGCLENRQRFIVDLYRAVSNQVKGRAIVTFRLGVAENNGLTLSEGLSTIKRLEFLGMPLVDVSCGLDVPFDAAEKERYYAVLMNMGIEVKKHSSVPVIGVGGILHPEIAEKLIAGKLVDLVAVGKALLADPQWAKKTVENRSNEIEKCLKCPTCKCFEDLSKCPVAILREKSV